MGNAGLDVQSPTTAISPIDGPSITGRRDAPWSVPVLKHAAKVAPADARKNGMARYAMWHHLRGEDGYSAGTRYVTTARAP